MKKLINRIIPLLLAVCVLLCLTACGKKEEPKTFNTISDIILAYENVSDVKVELLECMKMSKVIDGKNWNMQGGANDGTYGYFAFNDGGSAGQSITRIYKINLSNWDVEKISGDLFLGHANDVTYVPETHQLIVTWCETPAENASIVDADTLEIVENITYPQKHPNMTYCPERKHYVFASWVEPRDLTVYDQDLSLAATFPNSAKQRDHAQQCLTCDNDLIYFLYSPRASVVDEGYIFIHNWEGKELGKITFPLAYEAENISVYGKGMILAVNDHHEERTIRFYQLTFLEP